MINFYGNKTSAAAFANELAKSSDIDWQSITITRRGRSGEYSVSIAIDTSSDVTVRTLGEIYLRML